MKVLLIHNRYRIKGGEESVVETERAFLARSGMEVRLWEELNDSIGSGISAIRTGLSAIHSPRSARQLRRIAAEFRPDIVHVHNFFPLISPSVHHAASSLDLPLIQTIHNFRLTCANGLLLRDGAPCTLCLGSPFPLAGIVHRCYRGGLGPSAAVSLMAAAHRLIGTWRRKVDFFFFGSEFAKDIMIRAGLPPEKCVIRENFLMEDPGAGAPTRDGSFLFVGRISQEKGIQSIVDAWKALGPSGPKLRIVGDGPLLPAVKAALGEMPNVEILGRLEADGILGHMKRASATLIPSLFYEIAPRVLVESMATGTPAILSRHGAMPGMATEGAAFPIDVFEPRALEKAVSALASDPGRLSLAGGKAREAYLRNFAAPAVLEKTLRYYRQAIDRHARR